MRPLAGPEMASGDLGTVLLDDVIAPDPDDVVPDRRDKGDPILVVDMGEPVDIPVREPP